MTAYAARDGGDGEGLGWSWEMRSVNGRGLEMRLRLPDGLGALEAPLRKRLSEVLARGSVTLTLRLARETGPSAGLDPARLSAALAQMRQLDG
ncbi:YicC family protein, partial [Rhodobacterales bacterium HKCCSP123]|nr:YicC family protein [Rhodobacterales bacterium HKCCSP123]